MKYEKPISTIKDRIQEALDIRGMKAVELSQKTGISKASISQYLSGRVEPKQNRIYLIAQALNVSEAWLIGFDVPMDRIIKFDYMLDQNEKIIIEMYRNSDTETKERLFKMFELLTEGLNNGKH